MRDMTVLRQIAVHLDGWSDLRARVATEDISWPSVHVARVGSGTGIHLWQCVRDRWTGLLFDDDSVVGEPVATIQTTIGEEASARRLPTASRPSTACCAPNKRPADRAGLLDMLPELSALPFDGGRQSLPTPGSAP